MLNLVISLQSAAELAALQVRRPIAGAEAKSLALTKSVESVAATIQSTKLQVKDLRQSSASLRHEAEDLSVLRLQSKQLKVRPFWTACQRSVCRDGFEQKM